MAASTVDKSQADNFITVKGIGGIGAITTVITHNVSSIYSNIAKLDNVLNWIVFSLSILSILLSFGIGIIYIVLASSASQEKEDGKCAPEEDDDSDSKSLLVKKDSGTGGGNTKIATCTHEFSRWQVGLNLTSMILTYTVLIVNIPITIIWG